MKKQLRIKDVDSKFTLTTGELKNWLSHSFQDGDPVILKCGGKNFRLAKLKTSSKKPVLIGRRSELD